MLCPKCGGDVGDEIRLCDRCEKLRRFQESQEEIEGVIEGEEGAIVDQDSQETFVDGDSEGDTEATAGWAERPAGFWLRFIAYTFDLGFTVVLTTLFQKALFSLFGLSFSGLTKVLANPEQIVAAFATTLTGALALAFLGYFIIHLLYYALFESSNQQATPGKIILGLRVTDLEEKKLTFGQAVVRHLASGLSIVTFGVGFALAGLGERKQALHDRISGCLVTSVKPRTIPELLLCFLSSIIFLVVCQLMSFATESSPTESATLQGESVAPSDLPPASPVYRRDGGSITFDDHVESLLSSRVLWNSEESLIEVRFYPAEHDAINEADYRAAVLIGLRPGETVIDRRTITACFIRILDNGKEIELPCDGRIDDVVKATGTTKYLTGDVSEAFPIVGSFEGFAQIAITSDEPQRTLRWLLEFNAFVQNRDSYDSEHNALGEREVKSGTALLDRAGGFLTLGFFREELTDRDLLLMRDENSLAVIGDNLPLAQLIVKIKPGFNLLSEDAVESCSLRPTLLAAAVEIEINRDREGCDIQGELREGARLTGKLRGQASVSSDTFTGLLSWKLPVDMAVIDVDVRGEQLGLDANQPVRGYLKAGSEEVKLKSAVALYSAQFGRLEVGFYANELSAEDAAVIRRNRSFFIPVRDRRANLILSVRFAPKVLVADAAKIIEANLYIVRDEFGGFYFPGQYERQSIARSRTQLTSGELRRFSGELKDNAILEGLLKGEEVVAALGQTFSWKADFQVPVVEIN